VGIGCADIATLVRLTCERDSKLDVFVSNAKVSAGSLFNALCDNDWDAMIDVNVEAVSVPPRGIRRGTEGKQMSMDGAPRDLLDFSGKVVLVTGGAAGIGRAVVDAFAERQAKIALVDRDERVTSIAAALAGGQRGYVLDVRDENAVTKTVERIGAEFGKIDILVNNAGIGPLAPAEVYPTAEWDRTIAINLTGMFLLARAVAPGMLARGFGRIVNMASQASVIGIEGHVAYCASKAGIVGMTRCMALEWGPRGVTVNAVSPTVVETELGLTGWAGEKGAHARAAIPTRRFAKPWEIAATVLYLAGEGAAMVNGANLLVDGGYTAV
jgi:NAD(P)-dependent dehydrogenase (short-subunit alcohol dehydrogenase family)